MINKVILAATVCVLALPVATQAQTINFDVTRDDTDSTYNGTAKAPDVGTVWNQIMAPHWDASNATETVTVSSVTDSFGAALPGVSLSLVTSGHPIYIWDADTGGSLANPVDLMSDYTFLGDYTVTVSGLAPGSYEFWYYGHGDQPDQVGTITFDVANGGATGSTANSPLGRNLVVGGDGVSYNYFSGVTVPGSGELIFDVSNYLNGFQMTAVPEPTTFALGGLGLLALILARRR